MVKKATKAILLLVQLLNPVLIYSICVSVHIYLFSVQIGMSLKFQQQNFTLTIWQYVQHFCGSRGNLENERWIFYFLFIRLEVKCMSKKNWAVVRY